MKTLISALLVAGSVLISSSASAAITVYERVDFVDRNSFALGEFSLSGPIDISVTLTDFGYTNNFSSLGLAITSATEEFLRLEIDSPEPEPTSGLSIWGGHSSIFGSILEPEEGVFRQETASVFLEPGNYYVAIVADLCDSPVSFGNKLGLYGVEVLAAPVPPAALFFLSGLFGLYVLKRKKAQTA